MKNKLNLVGSLLGLAGLALGLLAGLSRVGGQYYLIGFELNTLLLAGIGLLAAASYVKLEAASCQC